MYEQLNHYRISRNFSEDLIFGIISDALQLAKIVYRLQYIPLGNKVNNKIDKYRYNYVSLKFVLIRALTYKLYQLIDRILYIIV